MGRIKSLMVKRASKQLLQGENSFDETFERNKKLLGSTMPSKPIRNKIAGYIARLKRMRRIEQEELLKGINKKAKTAEVIDDGQYVQ
ncbi:MAG: 30S ribosomal protein S17e [archaeon]